VGVYVSVFMLQKHYRVDKGQAQDPSVVTTPRARVLGVPNALIGFAYYLALLVLAPSLQNQFWWMVALAASALAAAMSLYLAYSLLFVTRMRCVYCWTGHVVNWLIFIVLLAH
jgi:uncharacterized membrane protein